MEKKIELKTKIKNIISTVLLVVLSLCTSLLLIRNLCYTAIIVSGDSMAPTLKNGEYGYAISTKYAKIHMSRFDIMVFEYEENNTKKDIIKRVVGLPGEKIEFKEDCSLYVDDVFVEQYFIDIATQKCTFSRAKSEFSLNQSFYVPEDSYFVLGDNRSVSVDSLRGLGFINQNQVVGVLSFIYASCDSLGYNNEDVVCNNKKYIGFRFF